MSIMRFGICTAFALLLAAGSLLGQGLTGQISGVVQDLSGGAMVGVSVTLTNTGTSQAKQAATDTSGAFIFPQLLAGTYAIAVTSPGFKTYDEKDIQLASSERLALRAIVMELGSISDSVSVTAEAAQLQTQSAERSVSLSSNQVVETPQKGRNFLNLLNLMPGVINTGDFEAPNGGLSNLSINGSRTGSLSVTTDGVPNHDTGNQQGPPAMPSLESIGEIKVQLATYQAEYGRNSGASITTVTKAGTSKFHGGAYYFKRNEALNANNFFGNRDGTPRPRYRYDDAGYTLGGPVLIPHLLRSREKLFFFWSQEYLPRTAPIGPTRLTFPTALERNGDFSQTLDTSGKLIPVNDPLNNKAQFPGNVIPPSRLDKAGVALLSVFPMPNAVDPAHTFNAVIQDKIQQPHGFDVLRVDWNLGSKTTFYARGLYDSEKTIGNNWFNGFPVNNTFPLITGTYSYPVTGIVGTVIHTFSTSLINEFTAGVNRYLQHPFVPDPSSLDKVNRAKLGINFPQFHPELNPLNVIPDTTFGGVQNAPSVAWEGRWIFFGTDTQKTFSDNLTKIWGKHNIKAGAYYENTSRNAAATATGSLMGTASFARDTNDPLDTNYAFSNAALGTLTSYTEANTALQEHSRYYNIEWFVQDNYRVTKRFTLDVGLRFYHISTSKQSGGYLASFEPSLYDPTKAATLVQPYKATPTSPRVGLDPATGQLLPAIVIGSLAPGSGTFFQGMQKYFERIMTGPAINIAPRLGFAWDVFGDGKTAVRGGFGTFPGRINDDATTSNFLSQPPILQTLVLNYTTIADLLKAPASFSPATVRAVQHNHDSPTNYNMSFGIQRDLGFQTVLDVSYVGALGRHLAQSRSLNAVPYGTNDLASSIDPTTGTPLPLNFLRPIQGYADITYFEMSTTSNYHSMQTTVKRRFQRNLTLGAAWTWSKQMEYTEGTANPFTNYKEWNYGKAATDRTHVFIIDYNYMIPGLSNLWKNGFARVIGDNWELSGITSLISGAPQGISYTLVSTTDITKGGGSGVDTRVDVLGKVQLDKSAITDLRAFDTSMVALPADPYGRGNAPKDIFRGPGTNNFDTTLNKLFKFGEGGSKTIQFRFETYNTLNHTQFSAIDTTARFDAAGNQTNGRFGQYTAARSERKAQLGLKFVF